MSPKLTSWPTYGLRGFLFVIVLLSSLKSHATHIVGADFTYNCVNPATNTYDVCLTVYRDAINGVAAFDNQIDIFIFRSSDGSLFNTQTVNLPPGQADTLPVNATACTATTPNIRIEYKKYTFTITLPDIPGGYDLGWARCCRNNSITNINNNQGITVTTHIPGTEVSGCNSSATFDQVPPTFLCLNQPFFFDYSATDPDGDSLVYQVSSPLRGINIGGLGVSPFNPIVSQPINPMGPPPYLDLNFSPGFSFTDPFGSGNFSIDPQTGLLTLVPSQVGISVFAVSVLEYRNGILISENKRDFQIQVINCTASGPPPSFTKDFSTINPLGAGNPSTGQFGNGILDIRGDSVFVIPNASFCYGLTLTDPTFGDTLEVFPSSPAFGLSGSAPPPFATLTSTGVNPVDAVVCWQVPCPNAGDTVRLIVGGRDINDCAGYNQVYDTTYVIITQPQPPSIEITTAGGAVVDTFEVDANQPFCLNLGAGDLDTFDILDFFPVEGPFNGFGGSPPFAIISRSGVNPLSGQLCWTPPCDVAGQNFRFIIGVQDNNTCLYQSFDTIVVRVNDLPTVGTFPGSNNCENDTLSLFAFGGAAFSWRPGATLTDTSIQNPRAFPTDTTTYIVNITDSLGCPRVDSVTVNVIPGPTAEAGPDLNRCKGSSVSLQASGGIAYFWDLDPSLNANDVPDPEASPDSQRVYYVTVLDTNGCTDRDSVTVTTVYAEAGPDLNVCAGDSVALSGFGSGSPSYSWTPGTSILNSASPNPLVFPSVNTTYTLTVGDSTGCVDIDSVQVSVVNGSSLSILPANPQVCPGDSLPLNASGALSYIWTASPTLIGDSTANPQVFPSVPATYYLSAIDTNGCRISDSVMVGIFPPAGGSAGADTVKCGSSPLELNASGGTSYFWENISSPGNVLRNPQVNPDQDTTYFVRITDANGCSSRDSLSVRVWEADAGPDREICQGDSVNLQAKDGQTYAWDASPFIGDTSVFDPLVFPQDTTEFFVTITDSSGCQDRDTARVNVLAPPAINFIQNDPVICSGDSSHFEAGGGTNYQWEPAALLTHPDSSETGTQLFFQGNAVNVDTTYIFTVEVEDARGCTNRDSLLQIVRRPPLSSLPQDTLLCPLDSVQLIVGEGSFFSWSPGESLSDSTIGAPFAFPNNTTLYMVSVEDSAGCRSEDSVEVAVNRLFAGPDLTICENDTATLNAPNALSYEWSPSSSLSDPFAQFPLAYPGTTTTYQLIMTDSSGCEQINSLTVSVNELPSLQVSPDTAICLGESIELGASGGNMYTWTPVAGLSDPAIANPMASPQQSRTYVVEVDSSNGCSTVDSVSIQVNLLPIADAGTDRVKCGNDSLQLEASGGQAYQWSPSIGLNATNTANPMAAPDSSITYQVLVQDSNGCQDVDSLRVETFYVDAGPDQTICARGVSQMSARGIGSQVSSFSWEPIGQVSNPADPNTLFSIDQSTTFRVRVSDSSGCILEDSLRVEVLPAPLAEAGPDTTICQGEEIGLSASGGTSYSWTPSNGLSNPNSAMTSANPSQSTTYIIRVADANNCTAEDSLRITVNELPDLTTSTDTTVCRGNPAFLSASGAETYSWRPAADLTSPNSAETLALPEESTTYQVRGQDANGCESRAEVLISVEEAPTVIGNPTDSICSGGETTLSVQGASTYEWSTGERGNSIRVAPGNSGSFWVIPQNQLGCVGDTFFIDVFVERNLPRAEFTPDPTEGFYPLEVNFFNESRFADAFIWSFGDGDSSSAVSPLHIYTEPGTYEVTLRADNGLGCPNEQSFRFILVQDAQIIFPKAFSPNNDGINDNFTIISNSFENFNFQVYNRWGELVFEALQPGFQWDGLSNGQPVPEGVYVFKFSGQTFRGEDYERSGTITVLR